MPSTSSVISADSRGRVPGSYCTPSPRRPAGPAAPDGAPSVGAPVFQVEHSERAVLGGGARRAESSICPARSASAPTASFPPSSPLRPADDGQRGRRAFNRPGSAMTMSSNAPSCLQTCPAGKISTRSTSATSSPSDCRPAALGANGLARGAQVELECLARRARVPEPTYLTLRPTADADPAAAPA